MHDPVHGSVHGIKLALPCLDGPSLFGFRLEFIVTVSLCSVVLGY